MGSDLLSNEFFTVKNLNYGKVGPNLMQTPKSKHLQTCQKLRSRTRLGAGLFGGGTGNCIFPTKSTEQWSLARCSWKIQILC